MRQNKIENLKEIIKFKIAVIILISMLMIAGCGGKLRTPPWSEDEIKQSEAEEQEQETVTVLRYKF